MYYISKRSDNFAFGRKVKRLSYFKGIEGERYVVRKKVNIERFDSFPIYIYRDGKLKKTDGAVLCGLFNY